MAKTVLNYRPYTDTYLYLLSLALALSIHNKLNCPYEVKGPSKRLTNLSLTLALSIHNKQQHNFSILIFEKVPFLIGSELA